MDHLAVYWHSLYTNASLDKESRIFSLGTSHARMLDNFGEEFLSSNFLYIREESEKIGDEVLKRIQEGFKRFLISGTFRRIAALTSGLTYSRTPPIPGNKGIGKTSLRNFLLYLLVHSVTGAAMFLWCNSGMPSGRDFMYVFEIDNDKNLTVHIWSKSKFKDAYTQGTIKCEVYSLGDVSNGDTTDLVEFKDVIFFRISSPNDGSFGQVSEAPTSVALIQTPWDDYAMGRLYAVLTEKGITVPPFEVFEARLEKIGGLPRYVLGNDVRLVAKTHERLCSSPFFSKSDYFQSVHAEG